MNYLMMVDTLAGKDITKHDIIYQMDYRYCLNQLSIWKYSDDLIKRANKL